MSLVTYSDSESDAEDAPPSVAAPNPPVATGKPAFQKTSQPGKIRIDLPALKPESEEANSGNEPPAKRARTDGAFSGFNSLLPPPKRAVQSAPKKGVSLKTSSEAAFSRAPPPKDDEEDDHGYGAPIEEAALKLTGKATMFVPTSVANKAKAIGKTAPKPPSAVATAQEPAKAVVVPEASTVIPEDEVEAKPQPKARPKQSLFSFQSESDIAEPAAVASSAYEPLILEPTAPPYPSAAPSAVAATGPHPTQLQPSPSHGSTTTLQDLASDLNLTPAQRRQLFGRNANLASGVHKQPISVTNFDLNAEYASNEVLRQSGEVVSQRAVKSIGAGKHSLQQLVNNARSQRESIEESWAAGKNKRGAGFANGS